jgi:CheY-like chemotaxis protein
VLVIDDEPAIGVVVRRTLDRDHDVVVATSGRDALARINRGDHFDVILCDLMMPDMTGMDVHALLGARAPQYLDRIVFVTGGTFTDAASDFVRRARVTVIEKPFRASELRALIRMVADGSEPTRSGSPS